MSIDYLKDLGARVAGAFVASLLSSLAVGAGDGTAFDITSVDWPTALSVAAGAAVLSLLKGLAARLQGNPNSPSLRSRKTEVIR